MTAGSGRHTVLVAVYEGRYLSWPDGGAPIAASTPTPIASAPIAASAPMVYVQGRLNGELLATEASCVVGTAGEAAWDTELAWELDDRTLRFLRSQRAAVKLECFVLQPPDARRSLLGFLMLDLRNAHPATRDAPLRWMPLVPPSARPPRSFHHRPEIRLRFSIASYDSLPNTLPSATTTSSSQAILPPPTRPAKPADAQRIQPTPAPPAQPIDHAAPEQLEPMQETMQGTAPDLGDPTLLREALWHSYRLSIDLRSFWSDSLRHIADLVMSYAYPPLTGETTISTYPPVHAYQAAENVLPHSFCAFEFVMDPERLRVYLDALPLSIHISGYDASSDRPIVDNSPLAIASLNMSKLLTAETEQIVGEPFAKINALKQRRECTVEAYQPNSPFKRVGLVKVVLVLEDFGLVGDLQKHQGSGEHGVKVSQGRSNAEGTINQTLKKSPSKMSPPKVPQMKQEKEVQVESKTMFHAPTDNSPPQQSQYQVKEDDRESVRSIDETVLQADQSFVAAKELDAILDEQHLNASEKAEFIRNLEQKKDALLDALASSSDAQATVQLQNLLAEKIKTLQRLEHKLVSLINSIQRKEDDVVQIQASVDNEEQSAQIQLDRAVQQARDQASLMNERHEQEMILLKLRTDEMKRENDLLVKEKQDLKASLKTSQQEIELLRVAKTVPAGDLKKESDERWRQRIEALEKEKKKIEESMAVTEKSKSFYKSAWMKALQDLNDLQAKIAAQKREQLEKERREIERFHKRISDKENSRPSSRINHEVQESDDVKRLMTERETLLKSGVYSEQDRLIQTLTEKIQELQTNNKKS